MKNLDQFYTAFDEAYDLYVPKNVEDHEDPYWDFGIMTNISINNIVAWHEKTAAPPEEKLENYIQFFKELCTLEGAIFFIERGPNIYDKYDL